MSDHYVCMGCGGHPDYSCYEHEGKFYCGPCFDNAKLESKNAELSALRAEVEGLKAKLAEAEKENRRLADALTTPPADYGADGSLDRAGAVIVAAEKWKTCGHEHGAVAQHCGLCLRFGMDAFAKDKAKWEKEVAEAEVVRLNRMISDALLDPSEVARLRKALATPEMQETLLHLGELSAQERRTIRAYQTWRESVVRAALAGLGEPTPG